MTSAALSFTPLSTWLQELNRPGDRKGMYVDHLPADAQRLPEDNSGIAVALERLSVGFHEIDGMQLGIRRIYIQVADTPEDVAAFDVYPSTVKRQVKLVGVPLLSARSASRVAVQSRYESMEKLMMDGRVWTHPIEIRFVIVSHVHGMPDVFQVIPDTHWGSFIGPLPMGGRRQRRGSSRHPGKARPPARSTSRRHGRGRQQRRKTGRSRSGRFRARR